jgi:hypothetical protein
MLLLQLVSRPLEVCANHNKWWTCNDACSRCARRVMPMEELITQLYPGLFSTKPPTDVVPVSDILDVALSDHLLDSPTASNASVDDSPFTTGSTIDNANVNTNTLPAAGSADPGRFSTTTDPFLDSLAPNPGVGGGPYVDSGFGCCET